MFLHDPDSNLCWFNPASFESDDFWLVGVILGLAYKKLRSEPVDLVDLAQVQPALARGLQQLLDYDRDVEETFCRTFVGTYEAWGETVEVELVEGGKEIAVTNANREEGFHEVCAGNAYSLFKAEELELVVRGSTEPLDVEELRSITVYEGFDPHEPAIEAFWDVFTSFTAKRQRTLLSFITASDRIPSTGVSAMRFKISCLGQDCDRLPTSHTCFDQLCLYRYGSREKMERMLVMAMEESEGFGLR
ncbi:SPOSA6832_00127 [Sporobolomyces salmonicolor]|uniref:HECT-type E3 ubiquitin transferase n=1 Tax=Sporidiobolus salmonicolor TaxID=5005 RepID=A0A0D6EGI7_SPOSA|nr:SPOSA6832_00127 [Sporobolomyces salmonicolor]